MTITSKPDRGDYVKIVSTRANDVISYIYATSSFDLEIRAEKLGGNIIEAAVSSF